MENWAKATLIVIGVLIGIAMIAVFGPVIVAALGIVAGVAAIFLPITILVVIIAIVKCVLDARG